MLIVKVEFLDGEGDGIWPDLMDGRTAIHLGNDSPPIRLTGLRGGVKSGDDSVVIRIDIDDGRTVIVETSLKMFMTAADMLHAGLHG